MTPRVFLSEPSGLTNEQRRVSDQWHERLYGHGFDVEQLRNRDYQPDPWPQLRGHIHAAHGVLVLGFAQLRVEAGSWRSGTNQQAAVITTWTTPWLHVEAGIALAADLPVLVAPESGVGEGVFAPETWAGHLRGTPSASPNEGVIDEWASAVARRSVSDLFVRRHR